MKIVALTGAGISRESGLATFRELLKNQEGIDVGLISSIEGWHRERELCIRLFNEFRRQVEAAEPNKAHKALAELEKRHPDTHIITLNLDDLHERAGSKNVLHLHGIITRLRSETDPSLTVEQRGDQLPEDTASDGSPLRPDMVLFGEKVPMMTEALRLMEEADEVIVVGTQLNVTPAATLMEAVKKQADIYVVDPVRPTINSLWAQRAHYYTEGATEAVPLVLKRILLKGEVPRLCLQTREFHSGTTGQNRAYAGGGDCRYDRSDNNSSFTQNRASIPSSQAPVIPYTKPGDKKDYRPWTTLYAPMKVKRGESFVVQVFVHKNGDKDEVTITARRVDTDTEERNSKPITLKLKRGSLISIGLSSPMQTSGIHFDGNKQTFRWTGDPISAEFAVSVNRRCGADSFVGQAIICIDDMPAASMNFKTKIGWWGRKKEAEVTAIAHDPEQEAETEGRRLTSRLMTLKSQGYKALYSIDMNTTRAERMIDHMIELLRYGTKKAAHEKARVFISSTSDMADERQLALQAVRLCGMEAEMYEQWTQEPTYPRDMCVEKAMESDIYVMLIGERYGTVEPLWDMSMTETEYRVAKLAGLHILIYIDSEAEDRMEPRQRQLADEIKKERTVRIYKGPGKLMRAITAELNERRNPDRNNQHTNENN